MAALPARSSSVVAGVNTNRPVSTVGESALHEPEHAPVTVNVTVRFTTSDDRAAEQKLIITTVKNDGWLVCEIKTT